MAEALGKAAYDRASAKMSDLALRVALPPDEVDEGGRWIGAARKRASLGRAGGFAICRLRTAECDCSMVVRTGPSDIRHW
jgi:hypothetical protein